MKLTRASNPPVRHNQQPPKFGSVYRLFTPTNLEEMPKDELLRSLMSGDNAKVNRFNAEELPKIIEKLGPTAKRAMYFGFGPGDERRFLAVDDAKAPHATALGNAMTMVPLQLNALLRFIPETSENHKIVEPFAKLLMNSVQEQFIADLDGIITLSEEGEVTVSNNLPKL